MNLEEIKRILQSILEKIIPIIVIIGILALIALGVFGIIKLIEKIESERYEAFQQNISLVIQKIQDINELGQNKLGINLKGTDTEKIYSKEITEIKELFNVDITQEGYFFLDSNHKHFMGIDELESAYVVNYDNGIVFCLEPVTYKNEKYYTILDIQKRLIKQYSYDFPIIPDGFKHKLGNWDTGYVIQDNYGNEFVWVPVGILNESKPSEAFMQYYRQGRKTKPDTEQYNRIEQSINKYGGFYIARFEASLQGATSTSSTGETNILKVVQNVIPLSQVSFTTSNIDANAKARGYNSEGKSVETGERKGAIELAESMAYDYNWQENGIYTCLMYTQHYDTLLYIVERLSLLNLSKNGNSNPITEDSTLWGNYINSTFRYSKENTLLTKEVDEGILLPTGSYFYRLSEDVTYDANKVFNVYDLAGNLIEWTMDKRTDGVIVRGGGYSTDGTLVNVGKYVTQSPEYASANLGIRVVMYIE